MAAASAGKVTITDLARRLGISKASVSYALNGQAGVSDVTRQRVLALASELGWYPSSSARALSQSRSETVGIVLYRDPEQIGMEPFYMTVLGGIEAVLGAREMNLLLRIEDPRRVDNPAARDLAVYERWAGEGRVDGVILFDHVSEDPRPPLLDKFRLPHVRMGIAPGTEPKPRSANVTVNQGDDAATLVSALRELGHRRIGFISGPVGLLHEQEKTAEIIAHARSLGMSVVLAPADYTLVDGGKATIAAMAGLVPGSSEFPTALIYGNDLMAVGGLQTLKQLGLDVPGQVSVISWDDSTMCQLGHPPVAALARSVGELGRSAAGLLLELIDGHEARNIAAPPGVLLRRGSLGSNTFSA